jgi:anti-sigma B factor antagonist
MPSTSALSIEPAADHILVVVNQPQLNDTLLDKLHADTLAAAVQHPDLPVVLDLSQVNYVPSLALGTLVMLMRHLKNSNRRFMLVGLQPDVRTVLTITRLDKLFEIHPNLAEALKNIRGATTAGQK